MNQMNITPSMKTTGKDNNPTATVQLDYRNINSTITPSAIQQDAERLKQQLHRNQGRQERQGRQSSAPGISGNLTTWGDTRRITEAVSWVWEQWIPNGFVTMIAAESGAGKSILALWIAGLFTNGEEFPNSSSR